MLLTDKYADKIYGTITCYDRIILQGYILGWSYAEVMTSYFIFIVLKTWKKCKVFPVYPG